MKNKKTAIVLAVVLACIIAVFAFLFIKYKPKTESGTKNISVTVVYEDGTKKEFKAETESNYLGDVLNELKLVEKGEYESGYYTVIDGIRADYNKDGAFWSATKDGEWLTLGLNEQPIKDSEKYEITYTKSE